MITSKNKDEVPTGTTDLFQINRTSNQAKLYFTPINGSVSKYHIMFGHSAGDQRFGQIGADVSQESNKGVQSIVINHLNPKTSYWFSVAPVNGCAVGSWSNWLEVKPYGLAEKIFYRWK